MHKGLSKPAVHNANALDTTRSLFSCSTCTIYPDLLICVKATTRANVLSRTESLCGCNADVAQLVAHHLAKVRVASSSLVIRSKVH